MTVTDNEIITALEHCSASMDCDSCNFGISENCVGDLLKVSLDLIIRLKEANKHHEEETKLKDKEIEILIRKKEALKDEIAEKDAEIERLKNAYKQCAWERDVLGKSEAYREFAERLKCRSHRFKTADKIFIDCVPLDYIDNLVKELTRNLHGTCTESNE